MQLIRFVVELQGSSDASLNGRRLEEAEPFIEEKVIFNKLPLEQQWIILSQLRKLLNKADHVYQQSRVKHGEISHSDYDRIKSGMKGVPGTNLKPL